MAENTTPQGDKRTNYALRGPDGLAVLGRTLHDLRGIRFDEGEGGGEPAPKPESPKPAAPAQETDWKAEARKHETRSKEWKTKAEANQAAADELAAIKESQKTDLQKRDDEIATLRAELDGYKKRDQVKAWAEEIVKDSPVPASALRGSTKEELEEHFQTLSALIPAPAGEPNNPQKPVPTIGQQPAAARSVPIQEQIAAAEEAGDKDLVASLKAMQLGTVSN